MTFKQKKDFLYLITDTSSILNFSACGMIIADSNQNRINELSSNCNKNNLIAYKKFNPAQVNYDPDIDRQLDFPIVVLEIKKEAIEFFIDSNIQILEQKTKKGQIFYELPLIPIHYLNKIIFSDKKSLNAYRDTPYGNINKEIIAELDNDETFFDFDNPLEKHSKETPSLIPGTTLRTVDGLLGGIQALIYAASEQPNQEDTTEYIQLIENIINNEVSELIFNYFGFNIISTSKKGILDIEKDDTTFIKLHKASMIKLLSVSEHSSKISAGLIDEIIDLIPGSILSSEEENNLYKFQEFCDEISLGKTTISDNWFKDANNPSVFVSLMVLLTRLGENGLDDLLSLYKKGIINSIVFIQSSFLFGCYKKYSSFDLEIKEKSDIKNFTLITDPLLLSGNKIDKDKATNPDMTSNWYEVKYKKQSITSITIDDPFYLSIVAQAREAGYKFIHDGEKNFIYKSKKKSDPSLLIRRGKDKFFIIETSPLFNAEETKKLTKVKMEKILVIAGSPRFRSGPYIDNETGELKLKIHQLVPTLDIPEIESMINDLIENYKKVSAAFKK